MFHLVLLEPQIPPNTGNAIRLCANTGATLHLIKPLGFSLDDKNLQRSGLDYHDMATVRTHASLAACREALRTARWFAVETGARHCYSEMEYDAGDAFLFGSETRGLPPAALAEIGPDRGLHIPMQPHCRSINLSNAVAIIAYEAWRQMGFRKMR